MFRKFGIRNSEFGIVGAVVVCVFAFGCASSPPPPRAVQAKPAAKPMEEVEQGWSERGIASWYGEPYHGRRTASGEVYDMHAMTAAHKTLPFGSMVRVERRDTGGHVKVRINDRGPFIEGRIIDLSFAAAKKIGLDVDGVAPVRIKVVGHEEARRPTKPPPPAAETQCFWVQVGAFSERERASRAESELEATGEQAVVLEGTDELWRVRLGPFGDRSEAERTRNRVTNHWPGAHIVPCG
jgi:rare lipoprotein A